MSEVGVNGMHNISEPEWKPIGKEGYREGYMKALEDVIYEAKNSLRLISVEHYCAYCGQRYPLDDPESPHKVSEHIATCAKHPMRKVEAELAAAREELERYRWIPVGEKKPENSETVLTCNTAHKHIRLGYYERSHETGNRWMDMELDPMLYVTHWMPLPLPPKADL